MRSALGNSDFKKELPSRSNVPVTMSMESVSKVNMSSNNYNFGVSTPAVSNGTLSQSKTYLKATNSI